MKFRLYIDEVGNPDLESSDDPNHRFLSLTGIIVSLKHVQEQIYPQMERLKSQFLGSHPDEPVVLHRKEIMNAKGPFRILQDPQIREKFDHELLISLSRWEYTVLTVCLDKKRHKETYSTWRYDPYHYCLAMLLERFVLFLNRYGYRGDAMAESRGGKEDRRLKKSFAGLWENGTNYVGPEKFQTALSSKQLKVKLKANNICGLQLADILAYPSRVEVLNENGLLEREVAPFSKKIIEILQMKYDQKDEEVFGKKFI